jgi:hypothetical protein
MSSHMSDQDNSFSIRRFFGTLRSSATGAPSPIDDRTQGNRPVRIASDAELESEDLRRVWQVLTPKRGQRRFLRRADIEPGELVEVLPYTALIEVHPQLRFRHRLVGTGYRDAFGFEATDTWIEDWPNTHQRGLIVRAYVATVEAKQPIALKGEVVGTNPLIRYEALVMPLSSDDETINMLFLTAAQLT